MKEKIAVVIVAAGNGSRMSQNHNKLFLNLNGKPLLARTIDKFYDLDEIDSVVVTLNPDDYERFEKEIRIPYGFDKVKVVEGGADRQESAYNGIRSLDSDTDIVLIHDGARPFTDEEIVLDCIEKTREHGAAVSAVPASNTIKETSDHRFVDYTPLREKLYEAQTPQGFEYKTIVDANEKRQLHNFFATDDSSIAERAGYRVALAKGKRNNIKITTPDDLILAQVLARMEDANEEDNGI